MSRLSEFQDQLHRINTGDPWYGDPISRVLAGVSHRQAAAHPINGAHSIWELVLHLTAWVEEVRRRVLHGGWQEPEAGDWPPVPEPTANNWEAAVTALCRAHESLVAALAGFSAGRLDQPVGEARDRALGSGVSYAQMLQGILQHDAYHLGQIALLRKALPRD